MEREQLQVHQQAAVKTFVSLTALPLRIIWISPFSCKETCFSRLFQGLISLPLWLGKETTEATSCPCKFNAAEKATRELN